MLTLEDVIEKTNGYIEITDTTRQWVLADNIESIKETNRYKENKRRGVLEVDAEIIFEVPHLVIKI